MIKTTMRLPKEVTMQKDAIEKYFCEPMKKLKKFPLDKERGTALAKLLLLPENFLPIIKEDEKPQILKILEKRIEFCCTYKVTDMRLLLFLTLLCSNPAIAVMYVVYFQFWAFKNNVKEINLNNFCKNIFPMGFPSEDDLHNLWDAVKIEKEEGSINDNLLDFSSASLSIQFMEEIQ